MTHAQPNSTCAATMSCGCPEWECDLIGHKGCTVMRREVPRPTMLPAPRPRPIGSNPFSLAARLVPTAPAKRYSAPTAPRVTIAEQRQLDRDTKRVNELTRDVTRSNSNDEVLRALRSRLAAPPRVQASPPAGPSRMPVTRPGDLTAHQQVSSSRLSCERMRVWEIAKRIGKPSAEVVQMLRDAGEWVANAQSTVVAPAATAFITTHEGV